MKPTRIDGERLHLRLISTKDTELISIWKNEPVVLTNALSPDALVTVENQLEDIEASVGSEWDWYYIIEKNDKDEAIGFVRTNIFDTSAKSAWLRFALGKERGKGFGTEAVRLMCSELFRLGYHRIECEVYSFNEASAKLLEKIGFRREGLKRQAHCDGDKYVDIACYGLLESDFS